MSLTADEFEIDGNKLDPDVTERVNAARLVGRDEGAMSLELTIWDGDGHLMRDGQLATARRPKKTPFKQASWARYGESRLILDGILFRLAGVDQALGSPLVRLTWDDEAAALMRRHTRMIKVSRGDKTRAGTIGLAVAAVQEIAIPYRSPEERISQNIEKPKDDEAEQKGLTGSQVTVKGVKADREQRKNIETILAVADRLRAGERATLALLVACIQESGMRNLTGGDKDSRGILQVRDSTAAGITPRTIVPIFGDAPSTPAALVPGLGNVASDVTGPIAPGKLDPRDVKECARVFLLRGFWGKGGAIAIAAKNPDMEPGEIAQNVQGSNFPDAYQTWVNEAKTILEAWGGAGQVDVLRESFEYQIGGKLKPDDEKPENYWAGANRLGNELDGWSLWAWRNQVNFISDQWQFRRKPVFTVTPEMVYAAERPADSLAPFVQIGYRADSGSALQEVRIQAVSRRWDGAPGSTVLLDDLGPMSGKWLISENDFDLQRDLATITLRRPMDKQPEPAPDTTTRVRTETRRQETGSPRARILAIAERAYKRRGHYHYEQTRPMPESLFDFPKIALPTGGTTDGTLYIDCSAFTTLVYKAADVPDPNGLSYAITTSGDHHRYPTGLAGYTGTLAANGKKTSDPQPGDMVLYGAVPPYTHVNIYAGDGECFNMGPSAGLSKGKLENFAAGRPHFFYTFDLGTK